MADSPHGCHVEPLLSTMRDPERATATASFLVSGMGCRNCAMRVRNALVAVEGVAAAYVGLSPPIAVARFDPGRTSVDDLLDAVASAGAGTHHEYRGRVMA